jgi:hypothetical protein
MSYVPRENLGFFAKKICFKKKSIDEITGSSIGKFSKSLIILISVWAIITTILSIISYVNILREPDTDEKLSDGWCITMLVFNGGLLIASTIILFVVILSFKSDSNKKEAVLETINSSEGDGATKGALVASVQVTNPVIIATATAAAEFAFQNSAAVLGPDVARKLGTGALDAGFKAGNAAVRSAVGEATDAVATAVANGTLDRANAAATAAANFQNAGNPRTGNLLPDPSSAAAMMATMPASAASAASPFASSSPAYNIPLAAMRSRGRPGGLPQIPED